LDGWKKKEKKKIVSMKLIASLVPARAEEAGVVAKADPYYSH
jgi:hypothetical protein